MTLDERVNAAITTSARILAQAIVSEFSSIDAAIVALRAEVRAIDYAGATRDAADGRRVVVH
jgi:hypothetical protein